MSRDFEITKPIPGHDGYFISPDGLVWQKAPHKLEREEGESVEAYKARSDKLGATHGIPGSGWLHEFSHRPWSAERAPGCSHVVSVRRAHHMTAKRILAGRTYKDFS